MNMLMINEKTQLVASVGFMCSLCAVGLSTHILMDQPTVNGSVIDGAMQSIYEASFVDANPLNNVSISVMGAIKYAAFKQAEQGAIVGNDGWLFTSEEFEVGAKFQENISQSATEIARVKATLEQKGIKLIPVIIPDKADVYPEHLRTARPSEIKTRRDDLLSQLATRNVVTLDAFKALASNDVGGRVFIKDDTHWSPDGSRAVAKMIASHLTNLDITLTPATVTTTQGPTIDFDGDLLQFVPTGALRPTFGPEQNQIDTYTTTVETAGGLFGDANVDVALVGTSFSAKTEWNFPGFLQDALGADVLNFASEGKGPFAPMHAFLASDTFQNTPPKIVVWEIPARYTSKEMNQ
jgi:alginate O-acetyltransferase complex protein AlgJ